MKRIVRIVAVTTVALAACGGGDGDAGDTTTVVAADDGSTTTTTTAATTTTTTAAPVTPGAGASDDFCVYIRDYAEDSDFSPIGMSPEDLKALFEDNLDAIGQAERIAPSEIRGDVGLFVEAYGGFVELMREFEYNFLAIGTSAMDDPRMLAMDDPELDAAGERIETFCGIEGAFVGTPEPPDSGSGSGLVTGSLPEGFPDELVPPNSEVVASVNVAGGSSVTLDIEAETDDVIAFYSDVIGDPMAQLPEPKGALWTTTYQGSMINVVVAEISPGMVQVNITVG